MKYPELSEAGNKEAERFIEVFKKDMHKVCEEVLGNVYVNLLPYIETDSWQNYRNDMRSAFQGYTIPEVCNPSDLGGYATGIRNKIFDEHRAELEKGIIADLEKRVKMLEEHNRELRDQLTRSGRW